MSSGASRYTSGLFAPARRQAVSETEIDGELVLLDTVTGAMHVLNRVAAAVWSELDGERDVDTIVADLSDATGAEAARVHKDLTRFLEQLGESGLLSQLPPSSGENTRVEEPNSDAPGA